MTDPLSVKKVEEHGEAVEIMRRIKQAIDPHNLMNPGKIF